MQLDPIDLKAGDINLVRYVKNNPLNFRDPLGLVRNCGDEDFFNDLLDLLGSLSDLLGSLYDALTAAESHSEARQDLYDAIENSGNPENPTSEEDLSNAVDKYSETLDNTLQSASEAAAEGIKTSVSAGTKSIP